MCVRERKISEGKEMEVLSEGDKVMGGVEE
jgi:hypothetical protein